MIRPWLLAFRPKTLSAAIVPVVVGTALVYATGFEIHWDISFYALFGALFIQIGTNLVNDAVDFKKGADKEDRLGPMRVTQNGIFTPKAVMSAGFFFFFLALLCGIPLVIEGGWIIVAIGLFSLLFGYAYTAGPYPLAYLGLGDLFVILFFGLIAVGGVYYLHTGTLEVSAVVGGLQVGMLATVLIAINNLRDCHQDKVVNKKTLAVRFGENFARKEIAFLFSLSFALLGYWGWSGQFFAALLPLLALPLTFSIIKGVNQNVPGQIYNKYLAQASLVHIIFGFQLALGLILL